MNPDDVLSTAGGNWFAPTSAEVQSGVMFGVGGTSETGSFPGVPPVNILTQAQFVGGTLWELIFGHDVDVTGTPGDPEPAVLWFSPTLDAWVTLTYDSQPQTNRIRLDATGFVQDFTFAVVIQQPTTFHSSNDDDIRVGFPVAA